MRYLCGNTCSYINDAVTSIGYKLHNTHDGKINLYRQFLINFYRFENILDLKYMAIYFIIIKHSYEFIMLIHKMIIRQLHTSSIDLYVKHAHY